MVKFVTRAHKEKTIAMKSDDVNNFIGYAQAPTMKKTKVVSKKATKSNVKCRVKTARIEPVSKKCLTPQKALPL